MKKSVFKIMIYLGLAGMRCAQAQDVHFSMPRFSPILLNPALTAHAKDIQAGLQYKSQWRGMNAYTSYAASVEAKANQFHWTEHQRQQGTFRKKISKGLAFGLQFAGDKAGDGNLKQSAGHLALAYHLQSGAHSFFSLGIKGGFLQRSISPENLRWNNQYSGGMYDATAPSNENFASQSVITGDVSAGLLFSTGTKERYMTSNEQRHLEIGLAAFHLNRPRQSFLGAPEVKLPIKYIAHFASTIGIPNTNYTISPSGFFALQGKQTELTGGLMFQYRIKDDSHYTGFVKSSAISMGCYYRALDAVIPSMVIEMKGYAIALSYDINVSGLTKVTRSRGGLEIALRWGNPSPFLYQAKSRI